ncbi:MAG TPA: HEAT repeat domain-containing protein [Polyangiaceae bacterium]|jgi:hypothetical protein|nr:HEAT repeat domain-containing protein [Polyangiaceae bacterium]
MNTNATNEKRRWTYSVTAGLLVACGAIGLFYGKSRATSAVGGPSHDTGTAGSSTTGAIYTTASLFPLGVMQEYDMHQTTTMATSSGQALGKLDFAGPLTLTGLEHGAKIVVRGQFSGKFTTLAAGTTNEAMTPDAQRPFFLEFAPDGTFLRSLGDPQVPQMVARIWVALGEYVQLLRQGPGDAWQSHEHDGLGSYTAEYQQKSRETVEKHKVKYDALNAKELESAEIFSSRITFQVDSQTRLESYGLDERAKVTPMGGPLPAFESTSNLTLKRTRVSVPSADLQAWAKQSAGASPLDKVGHVQDDSAHDKERVATTSLPQVFSDLHGFDSNKTSKAERDRAAQAFVALTSFLREDPKTLDMVKKHLDKKGPDTETMLAALRDASTPDSQKLLAEMSVKTSPLDPFNRMEAVRSLSRVPTPSLETVQTLKDLRSDPDVWIQANYGLGSSLHKIMDTDPVVAQDIRSTLETQLTGATTDTLRSVTLIALGNAGDPSTLSTIAQYVNDPSPAVRGNAAQALRRIAGDEADTLLARLAGDPDPDVRAQAVDAINERTPSQVLATALAVIAIGDQAVKVRAGAVKVLASWLPAIPAIAETLQVVASRDVSEDLKNVAKNALERT